MERAPSPFTAKGEKKQVIGCEERVGFEPQCIPPRGHTHATCHCLGLYNAKKVLCHIYFTMKTLSSIKTRFMTEYSTVWIREADRKQIMYARH